MSEKYLTSNEVMQFCDNLRNMSVPEALGTLGYTVVPDPPREPFGDVVVVDSQGNTWKRTPPGGWTDDLADEYSDERWTWRDLHNHYHPLRIYRKEPQ